MNKLVYVGKIISWENVANSDHLAQAEVICGPGGKWAGVVKRGELNSGDMCEVYLPDALLPEEPRYEFLRNKKFRITQCRLRGAISEVLILPLLPGDVGYPIGTDLTEARKVLKYEKPLDAKIGGDIEGVFPNFVPKTDEPLYQGVKDMIEALKGKPFYVTVKADGSSGTFTKHQGEMFACTRNYRMKDTPKALVWVLAKKYNLPEKMPEGYAVQFEMIGQKIQGNPLGINGVDLQVFNVWDIANRTYLDVADAVEFCAKLSLPFVPIIQGLPEVFPSEITEDTLRKWAEGKYPNGKNREGIVIRPRKEMKVNGERLSFKVINLEYGK